MNNVIYRGWVILPRSSSDGETGVSVFVTEEANGYAIWRETPEEGCLLVKHEWIADKSRYIEEAVQLVLKERAIVAHLTPKVPA